MAIEKLAMPRSLLPAGRHVGWPWVGLTAAMELMTFGAYTLAYRSIDRLGRSRRLDTPTLVRLVIAGFGPVAASGGFGIDRALLAGIDDVHADARATAHVHALSGLEWAVMGPINWLVATGLLLAGSRVSGSLLWPWTAGVPIVILAVIWISSPARRFPATGPWNRVPARLKVWLKGVLTGTRAVRRLAARPQRCAGAWIGMTLYWVLEICALYGAMRAAALDVNLITAALAYSTGYLASRRSLPLGGAGLCEALLVYALYEMKEPLGPALLAVVIYRAFNFMMVIVPSIIAYHQLSSHRPAAASQASHQPRSATEV